MSEREEFTSRWGLIVSVLGVAVGTGNIWRFPRIVAANGGGSFLVPWILFLFLWSIPLIMSEFAIGKLTRQGTVGSFATLMGKRFAWMGSFVGFVAIAIMFYYSVVTGWCIRYFFQAASGELFRITDHEANWNTFIQSGWGPVFFHFVAITLAVLVVRRGVVQGIEKANRFLVPSLVGLIVLAAARAVTLPGSEKGLAFLFTPDLGALLDYKIWLQALTQNAWDTGAGWGLILTYGVYMRRTEDIPLNAALIGLGNNSISLLAAIAIFSTVFATLPEGAAEIMRSPGPANTGLTLIWLPQLFVRIPGGSILLVLFFLALSFAALSSLISMVELGARILMDAKLSRSAALRVIYIATLIFGLPSALSLDFFANQDWTWGIALMVSGAFIATAVLRHGVDRFRTHQINSPFSDLRVGTWYNHALRLVIPIEVTILVIWWFWQVIQADPDHWWNPFEIESVGTCILQWSLALLVFKLGNSWIAERTSSHE